MSWSTRIGSGAEEPHLIAEMSRFGFEHQPGTSSFLLAEGLSLDLVGYSQRDVVDRIGGGTTVPVMVFSDLSRILSEPGSIVELPTQGKALSPAALAASKLLTVRLEKGSKDKLQALLLIEGNATNHEFMSDLRRLLGLFDLRTGQGCAGRRASGLPGGLRRRERMRTPSPEDMSRCPKRSAEDSFC